MKNIQPQIFKPCHSHDIFHLQYLRLDIFVYNVSHIEYIITNILNWIIHVIHDDDDDDGDDYDGDGDGDYSDDDDDDSWQKFWKCR